MIGRLALSLVGVLPLLGCNYVDGFSMINDTSVPLVIDLDMSSSVRLAVDVDCYDEGTSTQPPIRVTLNPGQRACFLGPSGEGSEYNLRARIKSLDVHRGGGSCLHAGGKDLKYGKDGRNAAQQQSLHLNDALCPSTH